MSSRKRKAEQNTETNNTETNSQTNNTSTTQNNNNNDDDDNDSNNDNNAEPIQSIAKRPRAANDSSNGTDTLILQAIN
jgi:hypothetical protein